MFRALVARANYLSQDRVDLGYAVKELCRHMAVPRQCDWNTLKRLGRCQVGHPRVVNRYGYRDMPSAVHVWVDWDHT